MLKEEFISDEIQEPQVFNTNTCVNTSSSVEICEVRDSKASMLMAVMLAILLASSSFILSTSSWDRKLNFRSFFGSGILFWSSISFSNSLSLSFRERSSGIGESVAAPVLRSGGRDICSPPDNTPGAGEATGSRGSLIALVSREKSGLGGTEGRGLEGVEAFLGVSSSAILAAWGTGE